MAVREMRWYYHNCQKYRFLNYFKGFIAFGGILLSTQTEKILKFVKEPTPGTRLIVIKLTPPEQ
jgi:hypothetical protein